jgi:hypothetical protein
MPLKFWDEAFLTATFLINMLPTKVLNFETPTEKLLNVPPNYDSLRIFGCACWPNLRPYNQRKLAFRSKRCVFLGYSPLHKGVKCLDVSTGRVYISRDVVFDEQIFPFQSLHPNAGAQLRSEILLLPSHLSSSVSTEDMHIDDTIPLVPFTNPVQVAPQMINQPSFQQSSNQHEIDSPSSPHGSMIGTSSETYSPAQADSPSMQQSTSAESSLPSQYTDATYTSASDAGPSDPLLSPRVRAPSEHSDASRMDSAQSRTDDDLSPGSSASVSLSPSLAESSVPPASPSSAGSSVPSIPTPSPAPTREPRTRLQKGITNPKVYTDGTVRYGMLTSTGEPTNLKDALAHDQWKKAMTEEYGALMHNKTWHLVPPRSHHNIIDCKWVYRIKRRSDGTIECYKASLVAKGF